MTQPTRMLFLVLSGLIITPAVISAQAPSDSIPIWSAQLLEGAVDDRAVALGRLTALAIPMLPAATHRAILSELRRTTSLIESPDALEDDAETFGEYYLELVGAAAAIGTEEAYIALIPSVGVSGGVGRRVARLGDRAVPALVDRIERRHDDRALATLGLAWFWADSTGAPLSLESRAAILEAIVAAAASDSFRLQLGAIDAIGAAADPVLLPIARSMQTRLDQDDGSASFLRKHLDDRVVPPLAARESAMTGRELAARLARVIDAMCAPRQSGEGHGHCTSIRNAFSAGSAHLDAGRRTPARAAFEAARRAAEHALAAGVFTQLERDLLVHGIQAVVARS